MEKSSIIGGTGSNDLERVPPSGDSSSGVGHLDLQACDPDHELSTAFPIVGIVASAGGLNAYKKFFTAMPADSGMAFVLIPHLGPSHESMMVELLSKLTSMPVAEAKQGMPVLVNSVYVIPPKNFMAIAKGRLQLSEPPQHQSWQTSIDFFLRSLAQDQGERAIGIVLSGTGSHGTLGVREIKLSGGMVMAQQPESAEYDQMPQNAISTGVIDYVLPPDQMPAALVNYVEQPYLSSPSDVIVTVEQSTDLLNQILVMLQGRTKYDFRPYRKPMVLRRIQRRMGLARISSMTDYLDFLQQQPEEVTALYKDLLISVTAFFRDPEAYQLLEQKVIPALLARHTSDLPMRVWVPGCATGEEAYSIAMLLFEGRAAANATLDVQIFASDIDADAIEVARNGVYPASIAADISSDRLRRFFVRLDEHHYQINKRLRESVVYSHQNLIGDAPFSKLDLISCRNLLIYLEPEMQRNVIALLHFALGADGYLLLGPSETIGRSTDLFETVSKKWRVFRRLDSVRRDLVTIPHRQSTGALISSTHHSPPASHRKSFKELTEQLVLSEYAPAAALCSRTLEVLYVIGPLVDFLEFPKGEITKDLLAMARPGLRTKLRATCRHSLRDDETVVENNARVVRNGQYFGCSITVQPITGPPAEKGFLLVVFRDHYTAKGHNASADELGPPRVKGTAQADDSRLAQQLEAELKSMSEELHSTIEELGSSNEELKTSNEELMSVNEELQSVNEELETSKEEMQSLNEELVTVNGQLQEKVAELTDTTDDLINLMSSTEIATLFLDDQLNIKRFTPAIKSLLNLLTSDIGRPLRDISPTFADDTMVRECQQVLDTLTPLEREVATADPRYYLRRILPYRTTKYEIEGVVITFVDLTETKLAEATQRETETRHFLELHESAERMQTILNTAADAIVTIDLQGKIESVNLATEGLFAYHRGELIGRNIGLLIPSMLGGTSEDAVTSHLETELTRIVGDPREVSARRKDGSTFPADLALSRVDHLGLYTGILRDISGRKQLQSQVLEIATDEQRRIGQELHDGTQQELAGLALFAGAVRECLDNATPLDMPAGGEWKLVEKDYQLLKQTAAKLTAGLSEANQHVQKLAHGIMPVQIDAEGLQAALRELAAATNAQQQLRCQFACSGTPAAGTQLMATQLYRIAQEALYNALKHSGASDILISLSHRSQETVLEVGDNGVGIDSDLALRAPATGGGLGLRIMEYRAGILGGKLQVTNNHGVGTIVRCTIPLPVNYHD